MRLQLFTDNEHIHTRLSELDINCREVNLEQINPDAICVCDPKSAKEALLCKAGIQILALSDTPSFSEASQLLALGLKGYANTYIHKLHLEQAFDVISTGNVWLYPSLMQEVIYKATAEQLMSNAVLDKLTDRQRQTALLVKEGKTNKEIAQMLNITERTVKAHLSDIFERTGTTDRLSLALLLNSA